MSARCFAQAIAIATQEPPGPVHLDLPEDVAQAAALETRGTQMTPAALPDLSNEVAAAIAHALKSAKRPLLITGLTFTRSAAGQNLLQFIERQNIPFVTTLHGKGFLPESHPNSAGVIGRARRSDVKKFTDQRRSHHRRWLRSHRDQLRRMGEARERRSFTSAPKRLKAATA